MTRHRERATALFASMAITGSLYGGPGLAFLAGSALPEMPVAREPVRDAFVVEGAVDDGGNDTVTEEEVVAGGVEPEVEAPTEVAPSAPTMALPSKPSKPLTRPGAPSKPGAKPTPGRISGKVNKGKCQIDRPEIVPVDDTHYRIKREVVEYHTQSIERINALGWSRTYDENGQKGIFVSGFGCTSDPHLAGVRRGDVIQSVNGKKTNNLLQVFMVWQKFKKDDHFEIVLLRKGQPIVLTYDLF